MNLNSSLAQISSLGVLGSQWAVAGVYFHRTKAIVVNFTSCYFSYSISAVPGVHGFHAAVGVFLSPTARIAESISYYCIEDHYRSLAGGRQSPATA